MKEENEPEAVSLRIGTRRRSGHPESPSLPSPSPSSFRLRSGVSLMEVLISVFVLSIGLIGLAALLPVGRLAIVETGKADRAGTCGRAGLYIVKTCRMLDSQNWSNNTADSSGASFVVDPLAFVSTSKVSNQGSFGTSSISRITLKGMTDAQAQQFFSLQDDLTFTPPSGPGRPVGVVDSTTNPSRDARRQLFLVLHGHAVAGRSEHASPRTPREMPR